MKFDIGDFTKNLSRKSNPENALLRFGGNNIQAKAPHVFRYTDTLRLVIVYVFTLAAPTIDPVCTRTATAYRAARLTVLFVVPRDSHILHRHCLQLGVTRPL